MKLIPRTQLIFYICLLLISIPFFTIYFYDSSFDGRLNGFNYEQSPVSLSASSGSSLGQSSSSFEFSFASRLIELSERLKHAEMISQDRKKEINDIKAQMKQLKLLMSRNTTYNLDDTNINNNIEDASKDLSSDLLQLPSIYHFLPHLLSSSDSLKPAYQMAPKQRNSVTIVFGIPTVKRPVESYLYSTLQNLIDNLSVQEQNEAVIIVFIAETDTDFVIQTAIKIESQFSKYIDSGLIEIIAPPESFYPDLNKTKLTLGDDLERVKWRTKQNLDFAYLMMYAQPKGTYYVQLEDDILTKPGYLTKMKLFAIQKTMERKDWLILEFCNLGFIGKMFKSVDLSMFILFFIMFRNDKPVDWLLEHFAQTKICRLDKDNKDCKKNIKSIWIQHVPSLFQHVGTHSSLKGKVQKLRDKGFGKLSLFTSHKDNPTAEVFTNIKHYKDHTLIKAYSGSSFFWGMTPKKGDNFTFVFDPEINIDKYFFRSGNIEHPEDKLENATIEILPATILKQPNFNQTNDGYYIIGKFRISGVAEGKMPKFLNPVKEFRITVQSDSQKWIIFSEIYIKTKKSS